MVRKLTIYQMMEISASRGRKGAGNETISVPGLFIGLQKSHTCALLHKILCKYPGCMS